MVRYVGKMIRTYTKRNEYVENIDDSKRKIFVIKSTFLWQTAPWKENFHAEIFSFSFISLFDTKRYYDNIATMRDS